MKSKQKMLRTLISWFKTDCLATLLQKELIGITVEANTTSSKVLMFHQHILETRSGAIDLKISSIGFGTYVGAADDKTDYLMYDAVK